MSPEAFTSGTVRDPGSDTVTALNDPQRSPTTEIRWLLSRDGFWPEIPASRLMSARETAKRESIALEVQELVVTA
jgi:hypothetical protein